jgi:hypothetical protein
MSTISVRLDAATALVDELQALSAALAEDAALCASTAGSLRTALAGAAGSAAGAAGDTWAALTGSLAEQCHGRAVLLTFTLLQYRDTDADLAAGLVTPDARPTGPR